MAEAVADTTKSGGVTIAGIKLKSAVVLATLFAVSAFSYADRSIMNITQEPMKHDLGLTDGQLGLINGPIFALVYAVLGIPIARAAERINRKKLIAVALALWSLATMLCGVVVNAVTLGFARAAVGGAESASPPASHSIVSDYFPTQQRGRAMAVMGLAVPTGVMVGTFIGGLITHEFGWRIAFAVMGGAGVLFAVVAWLAVAEPVRGAQEPNVDIAKLTPISHTQAFKTLLTSRTFWLLLIASAMAGNGSHGLTAFSASYFMRRHHLSLPEVAGLLALGKGAVGFTGVIVAGFLADKLAKRGTTAYILIPGLGALIGAVLLFLAYNQTSWSLTALFFVPAFFFLNWIPGPSFAAVQNMVDVRLRATGAAVLLFFITAMGAFGPWIVGMFSDYAASLAYGGDFAAHCPGGRAAAGATAQMASACSAAAAAGLQQAVFIPVICYGSVAVIMTFAILSTGKTLKL